MAKTRKLPKFVQLVRPAKKAKNKFDLKAFAEVAAKSAAAKTELGAFIEVIEEGEGVSTFLWEAKQPGYLGWRWSVTVAQVDFDSEPTLSEIVLVPGPESLVAPNWIPWADRLADYQALQEELEKQNALEAESAVADLEQSEDSEDKSN
jgi:hypothetical protein